MQYIGCVLPHNVQHSGTRRRLFPHADYTQWHHAASVLTWWLNVMPQVEHLSCRAQKMEKQTEQMYPIATTFLWQKQAVLKSTSSIEGMGRLERSSRGHRAALKKYCDNAAALVGLLYAPPDDMKVAGVCVAWSHVHRMHAAHH